MKAFLAFFEFFTRVSPLWHVALVAFFVMALADVLPILRKLKILKWLAATVVIVAVLLVIAKCGDGGDGTGGGKGGEEPPIDTSSSGGESPEPPAPPKPFSLTVILQGSYCVTVNSEDIRGKDKDDFWKKYEEKLNEYKSGVCTGATLESSQFGGFEKLLEEKIHQILGEEIKITETQGNP